jgi:acid stress chaperone HdeB
VTHHAATSVDYALREPAAVAVNSIEYGLYALMNQTAFVILAVALLVGLPTAKAQVTVDVSKITCSQFVEYKIADPKDVIIWITGFYHGRRNSLILDRENMRESVNKIEEYCFKHPDVLVLKAVEEVVGPPP